jgi:hypothetical protein|eukprot:COSAG01_NODE_7918_length_2993_cov_26.468556_2_plen_59_part_00
MVYPSSIPHKIEDYHHMRAPLVRGKLGPFMSNQACRTFTRSSDIRQEGSTMGELRHSS